MKTMNSPLNHLQGESTKNSDSTDLKADELINIYLINRFTKYAERNLSPEGIKFYNEFLNEFEKSISYNEKLELDLLSLHFKLIDSIRWWKILQLWIKLGKFTRQQAVINFADNAISKIKPE